MGVDKLCTNILARYDSNNTYYLLLQDINEMHNKLDCLLNILF